MIWQRSKITEMDEEGKAQYTRESWRGLGGEKSGISRDLGHDVSQIERKAVVDVALLLL